MHHRHNSALGNALGTVAFVLALGYLLRVLIAFARLGGVLLFQAGKGFVWLIRPRS